MDVRAQIAMVFHLDKCIGCHTCSLACKNIWTDRRGTEYMWWNNVETKPGTGYPTLYEDQEKYHGGWEPDGKGHVRLRLGSRAGELANIFYNPRLPTLDDYYHPWTYTYSDLIDARSGADQPVAKPVSMITGEDIDIVAGPAWDDDLGGSPIYAANDPALRTLNEGERRQIFEMERLVFFYVPRICNHCLNPGCLAACPAGAIYKRGEDGIVLVNQDKCRAWRMCVSGCPYKKTYFNWDSGKAEKCILCYPRQETQQVPACTHSCVGRIRYLGMLLYDAERIEEAAAKPDRELVDAQRSIILNPFDPGVVSEAQANGINDKIIDAARKSPVYSYVKVWELAVPHHPEWRTLPMIFYVPPLLPAIAVMKEGCYATGTDFFSSMEASRIPLRYLAHLFTAGNEPVLAAIYRKMTAGRYWMRARTVGDVSEELVEQMMQQANTSAGELDAIYHMTSLASFEERFVIPPFLREMAIEASGDPYHRREEEGMGFLRRAKRGL